MINNETKDTRVTSKMYPISPKITEYKIAPNVATPAPIKDKIPG